MNHLIVLADVETDVHATNVELLRKLGIADAIVVGKLELLRLPEGVAGLLDEVLDGLTEKTSHASGPDALGILLLTIELDKEQLGLTLDGIHKSAGEETLQVNESLGTHLGIGGHSVQETDALESVGGADRVLFSADAPETEEDTVVLEAAAHGLGVLAQEGEELQDLVSARVHIRVEGTEEVLDIVLLSHHSAARNAGAEVLEDGEREVTEGVLLLVAVLGVIHDEGNEDLDVVDIGDGGDEILAVAEENVQGLEDHADSRTRHLRLVLADVDVVLLRVVDSVVLEVGQQVVEELVRAVELLRRVVDVDADVDIANNELVADLVNDVGVDEVQVGGAVLALIVLSLADELEQLLLHIGVPNHARLSDVCVQDLEHLMGVSVGKQLGDLRSHQLGEVGLDGLVLGGGVLIAEITTQAGKGVGSELAVGVGDVLDVVLLVDLSLLLRGDRGVVAEEQRKDGPEGADGAVEEHVLKVSAGSGVGDGLQAVLDAARVLEERRIAGDIAHKNRILLHEVAAGTDAGEVAEALDDGEGDGEARIVGGRVAGEDAAAEDGGDGLQAVLADALLSVVVRTGAGLAQEVAAHGEEGAALGSDHLVLAEGDEGDQVGVAGVLVLGELLGESAVDDDLGLQDQHDVDGVGAAAAVSLVGEVLVGLLDLLEDLSALGVLIGVVLTGELSVLLLDGVVVGLLVGVLEAEDLQSLSLTDVRALLGVLLSPGIKHSVKQLHGLLDGPVGEDALVCERGEVEVVAPELVLELLVGDLGDGTVVEEEERVLLQLFGEVVDVLLDLLDQVLSHLVLPDDLGVVGVAREDLLESGRAVVDQRADHGLGEEGAQDALL